MKNRARLVLGLCLMACSRSTPEQRPAPSPAPCEGVETVAFVDVSVVYPEHGRVVPAQTVLVCRGRIAAVGDNASARPDARVTTVDGHGRYLMAGLADMHTHLVREEDLLLYLARGVTTVRNMWGTPMQLEWKQRIVDGTLRGPTLVTAGPIVDGDPPVHDGSLVVTTVEQADAAVEMHRRMGYDFIKVYRGLSAPVFNRIMEKARAASLPVAGHIPRAVGLLAASEAGLASVEHLEGFVEALQAEGSPVKGVWNEDAWRRKPGFVDVKRLPSLAARLKELGTWSVPTRVVKDELGGREVSLKRLASPEARYVPPSERAIWQPHGDTPPDEAAASLRYQELHDQFMAALSKAGARLLVGTDPGNPLVVPGFSVHDELRHLVRVGLTPAEALTAATFAPAEFLHATGEFGSVAVGRRADLVLLDGNPLVDITQAGNLHGVMARGRWMDRPTLDAMLREVAAAHDGSTAPFASSAPLGGEGDALFAGTFSVTWAATPFGGERVRVGRLDGGRQVVDAESFDPHVGQTVRIHLAEGGMTVDSDGSAGRGHVDATRAQGKLLLRGRALPGTDVIVEKDLAQDAWLGATQFLAPLLQLHDRLEHLAPGASFTANLAELSLGSGVAVRTRTMTFSRLPDVDGARAVAVQVEKGPRSTLTLDAKGWPVTWEIQAWGSTVKFQRLGAIP